MTVAARGRVIVIGGSIGGLLAGSLFLRAGWDVQVYERAHGDMEGRGAGITILPGLIEGFNAAGVDETEATLGVELPARIALDGTGNVVAERPFVQSMTSWGRLYESLKRRFPAARYHSGWSLSRVEQDARSVTAIFDSGEQVRGDLLIGADGLRSTVRQQFLPGVRPHYAGYIAWRCLADEAALANSSFPRLFERYAVCVAPGAQGIGYPVPGPDHSMAPGRRQYNVVWYHPVRETEDLPRFMTDDTGRHHPNGIPPALLSRRVRDEMIDAAQHRLAPQFAETLRHGRLHFFQPILDLAPPALAFGRVAIIGDAAFIIRPHVAMGVPKGAGDALALARYVGAGDGTDLSGLRQFESERLRVGSAILRRGRYLGAYMEAQSGPDPAAREAAERQRIPEQVMMETAAPLDYEALSFSADDPSLWQRS